MFLFPQFCLEILYLAVGAVWQFLASLSNPISNTEINTDVAHIYISLFLYNANNTEPPLKDWIGRFDYNFQKYLVRRCMQSV